MLISFRKYAYEWMKMGTKHLFMIKRDNCVTQTLVNEYVLKYKTALCCVDQDSVSYAFLNVLKIDY